MAHTKHAKDPSRLAKRLAKEKIEADVAISIADKEAIDAKKAEANAKKELAEYAELAFSKKLDLRKSLKVLKGEVKKLKKKGK